jgi:transmembrane sensor
MRYSEFTSEDFIMDELFKKWVLRPDPASNEFWEKWLSENPDKKKDIEEARQFIQGLNFKNHYPGYDVYLKQWEKLNHSINELEADKNEESDTVTRLLEERVKLEIKPQTHYFHYMKRIAASFILLAVAGLAYFVIVESSKIRVSTGIGETKRVILPDHTTVTLNANSKLIYNKNLGEAQDREVWIEGEGFFEVAKRAAGQKFRVYGNHLTVEVLGTKFNLSDRQRQARIVLNEGKVKLNIEEQDNQEEMFMKPGDLVEYKVETNSIYRSKVNPENYNSWKNNLLIFEHTPLVEIGSILENNFGYKVEFSDPLMKQKKLVGTFPANNPEELLWNLKKIYGAKVIKEKKYILF